MRRLSTENLDFSVYPDDSCPDIYLFEAVYGLPRPNEIGYLEGRFGEAEALAECDGLDYIRSFDGSVAYIEEFFVAPGRRSRGIGGVILRETLRNLREKGVRDIFLIAMPEKEKWRDELVNFYEEYGFRIDPEQGTQEAPVMTLRLG